MKKNPVTSEAEPKWMADLTSYSNPRIGEYRSLIASLERDRGFRNLDDPHSDSMWRRVNEMELNSYFADQFKGRVAVDLGGGFIGRNNTRRRLMEAGASGYVSVDRYHSAKGEPNGTDDISIAGDMLEFVAGMQPGSANIVLNGIDSSIIPNTEYNEALNQEIARVIKGGGIVLGCNSVALHPEWMHARGLVFVKPLRENTYYLPRYWDDGERFILYAFEAASDQTLPPAAYERELNQRRNLWPSLFTKWGIES